MSLWIRAAHSARCQAPEQHCELERKLVRCSPEQKQAAVESWMSGTPDYKVAAQYGVSKAAVYVWKKQLLGKRPIRMKKKDNFTYPDGLPDNKEALKAEIKLLQTQIHQLKLERDVLEKAAELVKKAQGINLENLTNAEKADVIDALSGEYRLCELLSYLKMAKSSYFYRRSAALKPDKYEYLRANMKTIFDENSQCYGYRRMYAALQRCGKRVSE